MTVSKRNKIIAVAVAAAIVVALALGLGLGLGLKAGKPELPSVVVSLTEEPGYTIILSWDDVSADRYIVEYEYNEYAPGEVHSVETEELSVRVERVKGLFRYRITSVKGEKSNTGEWKIYSVPPLTLPSVEPFSMISDGKGSFTVDESTLKAVEYRFKGELRTVTLYEIGVLAPGEEGLPEVESITLSDLKGWKLATSGAGEWRVYIRPAFYIGIGSVDAFDEELDKLYTRYAPFTVITVTAG